MKKVLLLRLHRWVSLAAAVPLLVVIGTGLVLSFEPVLHHAAIKPGSLPAGQVAALLARTDPQGQAYAIYHRAYDQALVIQGARPGPPVVISLATGEAGDSGLGWTTLFVTARRLHETLLLDLGWLVIASSFAMLALAGLGVLMGWPRIRNTVAGWHKGVAFGLLPLLVLSPLTGLAIAYRITLAPAPGAASGPPVPLAEAVRLLGASGRDLSGLVWIRPQGGRTLARLDEGGEWRLYEVRPDAGLVPLPRNWPRLLHEGNFAPIWPGLLNALTALALLSLLGTGLFIWARRQIRRTSAAGARGRRQAQAPLAEDRA